MICGPVPWLYTPWSCLMQHCFAKSKVTMLAAQDGQLQLCLDMRAQHRGNKASWAADRVCNNSIPVLTMFANSRFIAKQTNSSTSLTTTTAITVEQKGPLASVSLRTAICNQATLLNLIALQGCLAHAVLKQQESQAQDNLNCRAGIYDSTKAIYNACLHRVTSMELAQRHC